MVFRVLNVLALELLALIAAAFFLVWLYREGKTCQKFGKVIGYFALIMAVGMMICTIYNGTIGKKEFKLQMTKQPTVNIGNQQRPKKRPRRGGPDQKGKPPVPKKDVTPTSP